MAPTLATECMLVALMQTGTGQEREGALMNSNGNLLTFRYPQTIALAKA